MSVEGFLECQRQRAKPIRHKKWSMLSRCDKRPQASTNDAAEQKTFPSPMSRHGDLCAKDPMGKLAFSQLMMSIAAWDVVEGSKILQIYTQSCLSIKKTCSVQARYCDCRIFVKVRTRRLLSQRPNSIVPHENNGIRFKLLRRRSENAKLKLNIYS